MSEFEDIGGLWSRPESGAIVVSTGELAVASHPAVLVTPALGSCVGLSLWDPFHRIGGLAHIMLPSPVTTHLTGPADRFATTAVPVLAAGVASSGGMSRLVAKICGGSTMFGSEAGMAAIGVRNVEEVKRQLAKLRIRVVAEDTGGTHARTMELYLDTGLVIVRSYRYGIKEL